MRTEMKWSALDKTRQTGLLACTDPSQTIQWAELDGVSKLPGDVAHPSQDQMMRASPEANAFHGAGTPRLERLVYLRPDSSCDHRLLDSSIGSFPCHVAHHSEARSSRWCCLLRVLQICLFMLFIYCVYVILSIRDGPRLSKLDPQKPFSARKPLESDVDYDLKYIYYNASENVSKLSNDSSLSAVRARVLYAPLLLCVGSPVDVIILVHTSPSNVIQRNSIRQTWGGVRVLPDGRSVSLLFVMGRPLQVESSSLQRPNDGALEELARSEAARHQDILIGNFHDTYRNLSIKHELGLRWCSQNCPRSSLILKADDDAFIDVFGLFSFLSRTLETSTPLKMLACDVIPEGTTPKRSGKWAVDEDLYPKAHYPRYCSGLAYVMSMDLAKAVVEKTNSEPWLWVDDVWITGMLTRHLDVHYILLNARYCYDFDRLESWLAKDNATSASPCTVAHLDAGVAAYANTLSKLWHHVLPKR